MRSPIILLVSLTMAAALGGCNDSDAAGSDAAAAAEAENVWKSKCVTCHGATGEGNGAAGMALNPRPRSFHDYAWQNSTTDDRIRKVILEGGASVGLSPNMTPNPDLQSKPAVLDALVAKVRAFGP